MTVLFEYPKQAAFKKPVPKSKIYDYARPSNKVKNYFISQIDKIIWQYKLAPETINLPAKPEVPEIQIFTILLKKEDIHEDVFRTIDKAIAFPIFYELVYENRIKSIAAYKRPSDADASKWVVDSYFESEWLKADTERSPLPVVLDMANLYEEMLYRLMPLPPRKGESLKAQAERIAQINIKQKESVKLEKLLNKEKQFNRRVEINAQLRAIKNELEGLTKENGNNRKNHGKNEATHARLH